MDDDGDAEQDRFGVEVVFFLEQVPPPRHYGHPEEPQCCSPRALILPKRVVVLNANGDAALHEDPRFTV